MLTISRKTRAARTSTRHEDGTRTRSVVRRGVAPLLAVVVAASGLAASPAQAADPWIGLEAFAPEPITVALPVATSTIADATPLAAGLPQPSLATFVIIGKVIDVRPATGTPNAWKIGDEKLGFKWVYRSQAGTRLDNSPKLGNQVKVLASRLTTGVARPLVAERITMKNLRGTAGAPEVEINYVFTGALQSEPGAAVWTVANATSSVDVDVSGTATGEEVVEPGFEPSKGGQVTVQFVPAGTVFEAD